MSEENKTVELKDEELQQVAGGEKAEVDYSKAKYKQGDIVKDIYGWILKIEEAVNWDAIRGFAYRCIIIEIPSGYTGYYSVGETYYEWDDDISKR